ncbi:sulfur carrier protein ThiS [Anaerococcus prevotii]|uniref:Thiamine biosynthesis protein ThiS n=1 Tax=Anaerococcus prevotii ACS-065-V-Col13 TaxID=879305 RepID=F0GVA6_9FIRM|nr:sulfur carrier protein ThiS [Anaerococcus prevotii]EGC82297.1 thiamine biosynthesis protein ThiS [Anaerococcus prevotii ACS-065-V-Col13]
MLTINDKKVEFVENETLRDFLIRNNFDPDFLACEVDEKLVKKIDFDKFIVEDGSKVEVFSFVGGG